MKLLILITCLTLTLLVACEGEKTVCPQHIPVAAKDSAVVYGYFMDRINNLTSVKDTFAKLKINPIFRADAQSGRPPYNYRIRAGYEDSLRYTTVKMFFVNTNDSTIMFLNTMNDSLEVPR